MQTVLKEAGEVVYYIDTWFIVFGICMFRILLIQEFFILKTSFFQGQFVYLVSQGIYYILKFLKLLNNFLFCHLLLTGGIVVIVKMFTIIATACSIIYNNGKKYEHIYILPPVHKAQNNFLTTNTSPHFTSYTLPFFNRQFQGALA